jgi:acetylglutamate kinase
MSTRASDEMSRPTRTAENPPPAATDRIPIRVVKMGGATLADEHLDGLTRHLTAISARDARPVLVHGGGPEIARLQGQLGLRARTRDGLRVTTGEDLRAVTMALAGQVNKWLVGRLLAGGIPAVGLSGIDAGTIRTELADPALGRVGTRPRVDPALLRVLLSRSFVPVIAPVSLGPDGSPVNLNADAAAAALAVALGADTLEFVGQVEGVLDGDQVLPTLSSGRCAELKRRGVVRDGMLPKIEASFAALAGGVGEVRIGSLQSLAKGTATRMIVARDARGSGRPEPTRRHGAHEPAVAEAMTARGRPAREPSATGTMMPKGK